MKNIKKLRVYIIITIICASLFLIWFLKENEKKSFVLVDALSTESLSSESPKETDEKIDKSEAQIKVYITGQVVNPGVYSIDKGARIEDLLNLAGGPTDDADLLHINLSKKLNDEQQVVIPKIGDILEKPGIANEDVESESSALLVNINTADKDKLKTLPGVGDTIAAAIIEYREKNGNFKNIEELKNVYRIGEKTFERLKEFVTID